MKVKKKTGFTLIELLVVIAIIALLLSVLLPGLKKAKDYAKRVICGTRSKQTGIGMKLYSDDNSGYLPDGGDDAHGYALYRADKPQFLDSTGKPKPLRFALLYEHGYLDTPELFYCPGNRIGHYKYESYTNPAPWGTLPQEFNTVNTSNQWVRMGYTYLPVDREATLNTATHAPDPAKKFIRLNTNLPYVTDVLHGRDNLAHQSNEVYSLECLYPDGHVAFCNDQSVFQLPVWDRFEDSMSGGLTYEEFYYTIFCAVGAR